MAKLEKCPFEALKNVLIATDGSEAGKFSAEGAIEVSKACNANLYAICVAEIPFFAVEVWESSLSLREELEKKADEALDFVKKQAEEAGVKCETIRYMGPSPEEYIIDEAKKRNVDLIVIGKKSLFLGAVGKKIIGNSPCDVLVIPVGAKLVLDKILVATDGSANSEIAGNKAISIAKNLGIPLIILSVAKNKANLSFAEKNVKAIQDKAEKEGIKVEGIAIEGEPFLKIIEVANQKGVGLIVLGRRGRTLLEKLLIGSVAERVIGLSGRPVLIAI